MNNFEYIKTLSKDEMIRFLMEDVSEVFDEITDEMINYWREDEAQSAELEMWEEWLSEERK